MASSTSHFRRVAPWWALQLLGVAVVTWALGAAYTVRLNPEIAFWRRGDALKRQWAQRLSAMRTNKIVIFGGSACATSVEPRRLLERHGIPALNLGLGAGMGAKVLTRYALHALQPGDTLIVALEPELLSSTLDLEPLGVQFSFATDQLGLIEGDKGIDWPSALVGLRPGGYHLVTLLGKILLRQPLYRYAQTEFEDDGWHKVAARRDLGVPSIPVNRLSAAGKAWLAYINRECARRNVRVAYTLPWQFCTPENLVATQRQNLLFLSEVSAVLPALREPSLGTHSVREHFADTNFHPTANAAAMRTDELAASLSSWSLWSSNEIGLRLESMSRALER